MQAIVRSIGIATLATLAASSCSSPYSEEPCLQGSVRSPGPACAAPDVRFTIDGNAAKWHDPRVESLGFVQLVRDGDQTLFFHYKTFREPPRDGLLRWQLLLRNPDLLANDPANSIIQIIVGGPEPVAVFNGVPLTGLPIKWAFTSEGVELSVPISLLPFTGQAILQDDVLSYENGTFRGTPGVTFGNFVCWDPMSVGNKCASPLP